MKKFLSSSIVTAAVLMLAGCGGNSAATDESTVAKNIESVTSDAPKETGISIEEAGKNYVEAVTPTNCAITRYGEAEKKYSIGNAQIDSSGLEELTGLFGEIATARQTAVEELVRGDWPVSVKSDIEQMAVFWAGLQRSEVGVSGATDIGTWNDALNQWKNKAGSSDSGLSKIIRIKLSLPEFSSSECS
jgi:hypothetical protein